MRPITRLIAYCVAADLLLCGCSRLALISNNNNNNNTGPSKPSSTSFTFELPKEYIPDTSPQFQDGNGQACLIPTTGTLPVTGEGSPDLAHLDDGIKTLLLRYQVPGASVAITKDGKLIAARGYGWSEIGKQPVQPDSMFRIASVSKIITSVAAYKLCESKKLSLSTKVFPLLNYPPYPMQQVIPDARLDRITVQQLLQATAGWDRERSGDPLFSPYVQEAADAMSPSLRADPDTIVRYWIGTTPLDSDPGAQQSYSNFSYTVLGRVIAKVAGQRYFEYIRSSILQPLGIKRLFPGKTLQAQDHEAVYYPFPGEETSRSVFPNYTHAVPLPYGGDFSLETMEADTGWIASMPSLARFVSAVFFEKGTEAPLTRKSVDEMLHAPKVANTVDPKDYFASGWDVRHPPTTDKWIASKDGSLAGCMAYVGHRSDGFTVAWAANSRPAPSAEFNDEMVDLIWHELDRAKAPTNQDLFGKYD